MIAGDENTIIAIVAPHRGETLSSEAPVLRSLGEGGLAKGESPSDT